MEILSLLPWGRRPRSRRTVRCLAPLADETIGVLQAEVPEPAACGWFDSSWALRAGLQITEHETTDRVVNELPLAWWLAWQPAPPAGSPVSLR